MNATFRLQGLTKEDQLVSMVRYSPLRAHILKGAYSNGCPANWKTETRPQYRQVWESCDKPTQTKPIFHGMGTAVIIRLDSSVLNGLTLLMYSHHHGPVFRVDVEQGGGSHQVLRQVAQQWHCPANTINRHYVWYYSRAANTSVYTKTCIKTEMSVITTTNGWILRPEGNTANWPLIDFLEEAARSVTGSEDPLVWRDTRSWEDTDVTDEEQVLRTGWYVQTDIVYVIKASNHLVFII